MKKIIYTEEQINQIIEVINNLEFTSGKNIQNAQRLLMIFQSLNTPIGTEDGAEQE